MGICIQLRLLFNKKVQIDMLRIQETTTEMKAFINIQISNCFCDSLILLIALLIDVVKKLIQDHFIDH